MPTEPPSGVIKLAEAIEYQTGSIVSRTLLDRKTGTLTLFAFDAGQALSEHTAPFDALVQILDGRAEVSVGKQVHHPAAGELVWLPAHVPHALRATERFKMLLTMIRAPKE